MFLSREAKYIRQNKGEHIIIECSSQNNNIYNYYDINKANKEIQLASALEDSFDNI